MKRLLLAGLVLWGGATFAHAGVFDRWLSADAPPCVDMQDIAAVSKITQLDSRQFEFVRAFYIAIPPMSKVLPAGDDAYTAEAEGETMMFLAESGVSCARFEAPPFVKTMLDQVGKGIVGRRGSPI